MQRIGVVAAVACGFALCAPMPLHAARAHYAIHGQLTAPVCDAGYDIEQANVVVRNQNNKVVGVATTSMNRNASHPLADCKVVWTVHVPKAQMYQMEIGSHGAPVYSFGQMQHHHWQVKLTLT